jgi:hypothetical protein
LKAESLVSPRVTTLIIIIIVGAITIFTFTEMEMMNKPIESNAQICCENLSSESGNSTSTLSNISAAKGNIVSLQRPEGSNMTWVAFGTWNASKINSSAAEFSAKFEMVKADSSEWHKIQIADFKLTNRTADSSSVNMNGTATVTIARSSLKDVPIAVKIMDYGLDRETVSIWIDPGRVQNHFGSAIYGTVKKLS